MKEKTYTLVSADPNIPVFKLLRPTDVRLSLDETAVTPDEMGMSPGDLEAAVMGYEAVDVNEAQAQVQTALRYLPGLDPADVEVTNHPDALDEDTRQSIADIGGLNARGMYDIDSGKVYLFTDNMTSPMDVMETFLHEAVAHKGLRIFYSQKELNAVLADIAENSIGEARKLFDHIVDKYGLDTTKRTDSDIAAEELIAHMAERGMDSPLLQRVIDRIRQILRELGLLNKWTDNDIKALLRDVRSRLRGRPLDKIVMDRQEVQIEGTEETAEVVVTADVMLRRQQKRLDMLERLRGCVG